MTYGDDWAYIIGLEWSTCVCEEIQATEFVVAILPARFVPSVNYFVTVSLTNLRSKKGKPFAWRIAGLGFSEISLD